MRVYGIKIKSCIFEEKFAGTLGADPNEEREREKKGVEFDYLGRKKIERKIILN